MDTNGPYNQDLLKMLIGVLIVGDTSLLEKKFVENYSNIFSR
ncbi:MAG: hypothetical protein ACFFDH_00975 [Promethearchaeota archaeon]